jgi:hypothetical protein
MQHHTQNRRRAFHLRAAPGKVTIFLALTLILAAGLGTATVAQPADCNNLVADSGLESGSGWATEASGSYQVISGFRSHSGANAAHLAGVDNASDQLATTLALPADRSSVTLTFWWQIQSEEESSEFDGITVLVADAAGNQLRSVLTLGSGSASTQWQQTSVDLSEFAGQTIQLKFVAQTDESLVTDFFIDDVAVTACSGAQGFRLFLPYTDR